MKRLYWKIFGFLLIAQLTAITTISSGFWLHHLNRTINSEGVENSPPARTMIQSASATLTHGGKSALLALLEEWQSIPGPTVLAIDTHGADLLAREYSPKALETAQALIKSNATRSVSAVKLPNGEVITLFVPEGRPEGHRPPADFDHRGAPPPHGEELLHRGQPPELDGPAGIQPPARLLLDPRQSNQLPFWPITASILVSLIFAAIIAWYFSKPIQLLHSAFSKGAEGDLDSHVAEEMGSREDALSDLGKNFDVMAKRLSKLLTGQKRLLNHVSHELRSPLSRIQIAIGLAKQNSNKIPSSLDRIQLESERMDQLIGELLQLSKLESGVSALNYTTVNLSHLLQDIIADASFEANEKSIQVNSKISDNCFLYCDADLIFRAIENVVRNALKYSHDRSTIQVTLQQYENQQLLVRVIDQGEGVDESALEQIFQPFVRTNHAQPKHGYGIGLALARQIIEVHRGKIMAENNQNQPGLTINISLPAEKI